MKKTPLRRTSGPTGKKFMLMPPAVWFGGWPFSWIAYCSTRWSRFDLCEGRKTIGERVASAKIGLSWRRAGGRGSPESRRWRGRRAGGGGGGGGRGRRDG